MGRTARQLGSLPRVAWRRGYGGVFAIALVLTSQSVAAEPRRTMELEPVTPHFGTGGITRADIFTVGLTWGSASRTLIPYAGGGLGFFTLQARVGATWLPGDLTNSGLMVRLEARPQVFLAPCFEPVLFGNLGIGYRWPLERSYPGESPGTAMYLLPSFDGGEAWVRTHCVSSGAVEPRKRTTFVGGTIALGVDW